MVRLTLLHISGRVFQEEFAMNHSRLHKKIQEVLDDSSKNLIIFEDNTYKTISRKFLVESIITISYHSLGNLE